MAVKFIIPFCAILAVGLCAQSGLRNPTIIASRSVSGPPAITFTQKGFTNTTAAAALYITTPFSSVANELLLAVCVTGKGSAPDAHNVTSPHGTWTMLANTNYDVVATPLHKLTVWRTMAGSVITDDLTNDFAGVNQTGGSIVVFSLGNVDTTGTFGSGAIVQDVMNAADATANPSVTLGALGHANNAVFFCSGNDINGYGGTAAESWLELYDSGFNTPATGIYVGGGSPTSDTTVTLTRASADWGIIAIEIKNASQQ